MAAAADSVAANSWVADRQPVAGGQDETAAAGVVGVVACVWASFLFL